MAKSIIQTKEEKARDDIRDNCNLVYYELSTFITFFVNLGMPFEVSRSLLVEVCDKLDQDKDKQLTLLTELRASQRNQTQMFTN